MAAEAVVVVDPYSSGRFLLYELQGRGVPIICVRSSLNLGSFFLRAYDAHKDYFAETVDYESLPQLLDTLGNLPYRVTAVFPGCEPGVTVADELAEALKLPAANGTELTAARKDKAEMQERLRLCGVPAAEQVLSDRPEELLSWARARGSWPLVAKPTGSSGSDGVFFCQGERDVAAAAADLLGKTNPNGGVNSKIVLQEFLTGTEYIIDTVSHNGRHLCCAVWVYTKRRGTPWNPNCIVSENNQLLPAEGEVQQQLVDYVFRVLTAVGMKYGPCHTEVMLTPRGPILVEVNARLHGLQGPKLIGLATGTSQAAYAVDAVAGKGELFESHYNANNGGRWMYPLQKQCMQMVLISPVSGYLKTSISKVIYEMGLPSVVEVLPSVQKRHFLSQSCDLNTAAGYVLMVHPSAEQIDEDVRRVRAAEVDGTLYEVCEEPLPESPAASPPRSRAGSNVEEATSPRLQSVEKADELWASLQEADGKLAAASPEQRALDGELLLPPSAEFQMVELER